MNRLLITVLLCVGLFACGGSKNKITNTEEVTQLNNIEEVIQSNRPAAGVTVAATWVEDTIIDVAEGDTLIDFSPLEILGNDPQIKPEVDNKYNHLTDHTVSTPNNKNNI